MYILCCLITCPQNGGQGALILNFGRQEGRLFKGGGGLRQRFTVHVVLFSGLLKFGEIHTNTHNSTRLYIELTMSFLIGQKHTVNFQNQRLWRHNITADYTIIMSRTLKVMGNHVMYDRGA